MKQKMKKIFAAFISVCIILSAEQFSQGMAFAAEGDSETQVPAPVFEEANPKTESAATGLSGEMSLGSISLVYRLKEAQDGKVSLLSFGQDSELYIDAASGQIGVRFEDTDMKADVENTSLDTQKWHTISVTLDGEEAAVFADGTLAERSGFSGSVDASSVQFGKDIYCSKLQIYDAALSEEQIELLHSATSSVTYPDGTEKMEGYKKTKNREIFNSGMDGSAAYRIPAIVTSKKTGTVIASIDKRWNGWNDVGVIDSVIRRSEDGGETWQDTIPVIALSGSYAYTVDPALLVDNDENSEYYGRIYMLVDMFQQGTGFGGAQAGTGYVEAEGKKRLKLTDKNGGVYTVRENGTVYNSQNEITEYRVETEAAAPFTAQGELYKNGVRIGNIYRNSELTFFNTCYLWMTYSDDDGLTWSVPKDITPEVKDEWMKFCGTGPGMGVQTKSGRLIFPAYCTNAGGIQSSFNVYSDDDGKTWHQGGSPNNEGNMENAESHLTESCIVELNNGHLMQFMRSYNGQVTLSVSTDEGVTWGAPVQQSGVKDPYCQMSAVHYPGKILDPADGQEKEAIIFSNPGPDANQHTTNGREYGTVRIAFVNEDDTLNWAYRKLIEEKKYLYSSLTVMNDGTIGLIYEHESYAMVGAAFTSFSPQYIMDSNVCENTPAPTGLRAKCLDKNGRETEYLLPGGTVEIEADFSQNVFAAGNVTLEVKAGGKTKEALLAGNVDADTLKFVCPVEESDPEIFTVTGNVFVKDGGAAETVYNVSLTDKPYVMQEISVGKMAFASEFDELSTQGMHATAGSEHPGAEAELVLNDNVSEIWHSKYDDDNVGNNGRKKHYVTIDLGGNYLVSGLTYTPRSDGGNGNVTKYQIEVSANGTDFTPVGVGNWAKTASEKTAYLKGAVLASHVRFRVLETGDEWATAAKIRIIGTANLDQDPDKTELLGSLMKFESYGNSLKLSDNEKALEEAKALVEETLQKRTVSEEELEGAASAAKNAFSGLFAEASEKMPSLIEKSQEKSEAHYNITTWKAYMDAVEAAGQITEDSSEDEVTAAYLNLLASEDGLSFSIKGNTELLEEMKAIAENVLRKAEEELKEDKFTADSWKEYQKAYTRLKEAVKTAKNASVLKQYIHMLSEAEKMLIEKTPDPGQNPDPDPGQNPNPDPGQNPNPVPDPGKNPDVKPEDSKLSLNKIYTASDKTKLKYKVTNIKKQTVSIVGTASKKSLASLNIKAEVTIEGKKCKITEIGAKAFAGCKNLKKVTIGTNVTKIGKQAFSGCSKLKEIKVNGKALKKVEAKALKGIHKKAVIKVPKAYKGKYKKLFSGKGQAKTVKIK